MQNKALFLIIAGAAIALSLSFLTAHKSNPPITNQVEWNSAETEALFSRACANCHSHQTKWPWYSSVPVVGKMIEHNVEEARQEFNISSTQIGEADEAAEEVQEAEMPPWDYLLLHPEARLSEGERAALARGLRATFQ